MDKKYLVVKKRSEIDNLLIPEFDIQKDQLNINVENSTGWYIADNLNAIFDIPSFRKSLVDGFAVKTSNIAGASSSNPVPLKLVGKLKIGETFEGRLKNGETVFVPTGGVVPDGADAVVMIEHTVEHMNEIFFYKDVADKENLLEIGDDIKKGTPIIKRGERINSAKISAIRAFGYKKIPVYEKIKVGIVSTGDELIDSGKVEFGKIFDINGYTLFSESEEMGFLPKYYGILKDDKELIKKTLKRMLEENDVIVMSGGTSKGNYDYTVSAIESLEGGKVLVHGLHLSPGKPTVLGVAKRKLIAGLSGNPLASFLIFRKVISPLICKKCGFICKTNEIFGEVMENIPSRKGREEFVLGKLHIKNGKNFIEPLFSESAFTGNLSISDGFITIPLLSEGIKKGEKVKFELW